MTYNLEENIGNLSSRQRLELLLDKIAEAIIYSSYASPDLIESGQKYIRDGQLQSGTGDGILALFQKDIKANEIDLQNQAGEDSVATDLQTIANQVDFNSLSFSFNSGADEFLFDIFLSDNFYYNEGISITNLIVLDGEFSNTSQFIPLEKKSRTVDVDKANEFLDTNIFELLPSGDSRQQRIIRFFNELNALLPPNLSLQDFDQLNSQGDAIPDGRVDRDENNNWIGAEQHNLDNSIVNNSEDGFIHRRKDLPSGEINESRTIEDIYNTIVPYLTDFLEPPISPQDDRPVYENQSSGYLQFRNPNQGIIIRNTNQEFIEGLDPNNPTYLETGFTITMWVRFLDKVSEGTLFNFGNPIRGTVLSQPADNAFGFKLETYVLNRDDECPHNQYTTWNDAAQDNNYSQNIFQDSNTARFVRLIVNQNSRLYDSHVGSESITSPNLERFDKLNSVIPFLNYDLMDSPVNASRLLNTTFIPENFNEWYFICASFNPNIQEDASHNVQVNNQGPQGNNLLEVTPNYWLNHILPSTNQSTEFNYTNNSNYGNKCKVEIISKSDLLRARGFKV